MLNPSSFITRSPLDNMSIRYANELAGYVALRLFPKVTVNKKTGEWYIATKDNLRLKSLDAPSGTEAPTATYSYFKRNYTLKEKAQKMLVLEKDARDFDRPVAQLDEEAGMTNMDALMIELEDAAHTKATTSGNYPSGSVLTLSAGDTWADDAGDPVADIRTQRQVVFELCGKYPNVLTLSKKGLDILKNHPAVVDRYKYTFGGSYSAELLARLFDLEEICASEAIKNSANEGAADSMASIWDDDAVLSYRNPNPSRLRSVTYGVTLFGQEFYTKHLDAAQLGRGLGAHYLESGWEWTMEHTAAVSSSDGDSTAGALVINIF
jgi:hypothetical protein